MAKPYLVCKERDGSFYVEHNCSGRIGFASSNKVDIETYRLVQLAIEEGKRERSRELKQLLEDA